jgi:hypothetical protein
MRKVRDGWESGDGVERIVLNEMTANQSIQKCVSLPYIALLLCSLLECYILLHHHSDRMEHAKSFAKEAAIILTPTPLRVSLHSPPCKKVLHSASLFSRELDQLPCGPKYIFMCYV